MNKIKFFFLFFKNFFLNIKNNYLHSDNRLVYSFKIIIITILTVINVALILSVGLHVYQVHLADFKHTRIIDFHTNQSNFILIWINWIFWVLACSFNHPITYAFWQAFYASDMLITMIINTICLGFFYRNSIFIKQTKLRYLFWFLIFYIAIVLGVHFVYYFEKEIFYFIKAYIYKDIDLVITITLLFYIFTLIILLVKVIRKKK